MALKKMIMAMCIGFSLNFIHVHTYSLTGNSSQARTRRSSDSGPSHILEKYQRAARVALFEMHHSYDRKSMSRLTMSCKNSAYKMILADYPFAEVRWKHNGQNFVLQPSRMVTSLNSLTLQNVIPEDSGVYHCQLALGPDSHIVVAVFSVVVGENVKHVAKGEPINLDCHSYELGKLFPNSTRVWTDPQDKERFHKPAVDQSGDIISSADQKNGGKWVCTVKDRTLDKEWLTARLKVTVGPAPPLWKKIRSYTRTHKAETIVILFTATFALVLLLNCLTKILDWKQRKFKAELDEIQKVLGITDGTLGTENVPLLLGEADDSSTEEITSGCDGSGDNR